MAIKVNARETELKFGKEATYHSAMIWKMKQIHITQILEPRTALRRFIAAQEINQNLLKEFGGQSPEMVEPWAA